MIPDLDVSSLVAGFIFGVIGLWLLKRGRQNAHPLHIFIGLALMVYPYFVSSAWLAWLLGIGLCVLAYVKRWQ